MNIGGFAQQQSPLALALGQTSMAQQQQEQLSKEERQRRQQALWDAIDRAYQDFKKPSPVQSYLLGGGGGGSSEGMW